MKVRPSKLKISGLNSFTNEQTIDFTKLTEKGLFGIFGPTGSGKSTILDAMTIALYGQISRGTREFINTETGELAVKYEFEIGPRSERKLYEVERHMKKDQSTGGYKTSRAVLSEKAEGTQNVLCDKAKDVDNKIMEIIGLNGDDFTRSVVLPQGKFSDFLKLKGLDRRKMLERIFGLERYGSKITDNIRKHKRENENNKNYIEGQLKRYEGISEEFFKEEQGKYSDLTFEVRKLQEEKKQLDAEYERYRTIWQLQEELELNKKKLSDLNIKKADVDDKKTRLQRARKAAAVKPFIDNEQETENRIKLSKINIEKLEAELESINSALAVTEDKYNKAYSRKEKELPALIEKESRLKQAIEIEAEIKNIEQEKAELAKSYKSTQQYISSLNLKLEELLKKKQDCTLKVEQAEKLMEEIAFSPEYREKVSEALSLERQYFDMNNKLQSQEEKINFLNNSIKETGSKYKHIQSVKEQKEKEHFLLEDRKALLLKNSPGDSNLLLSKKEELKELEIRIKSAAENRTKCDDLSKYINAAELKNQKLEEELEGLKGLLGTKRNSAELLLQEINDMELSNRAGFLAMKLQEGDPCPVCGSIHHPRLAQEFDDNILKEKTELLNDLKQEVEKLTYDMNHKQTNFAVITGEIKIKKIEYEEVLRRIHGIDLGKEENKFTSLKNEFDNLKMSIETWQQDVSDIEIKLSALNKEIADAAAREAATLEGLRKDREILQESTTEIKSLRKTQEEVFLQYNSLKTELKIDNAKDETDRLNRLTREEMSLRKTLTILRNNIKQFDIDKETIENGKADYELQRAKLEESGKQKKASIDEKAAKVNDLSEGKEPRSKRQAVIEEIEEIKSDESSLKTQLNRERISLQKVSEEKASEDKNLSVQSSLFNEQHEKLMQCLDENEFEDSKDAELSLMNKEVMNALHMEINSFDREFQIAESNIINLNNKLNGESIDKESWDILLHSRDTKEAILEEKKKSAAAMEATLLSIENDLKEVNKLTNEMKTIEHSLDILDDLDKLVQGNKFVEFVSMNQLRYVALEASRRLREITGDRYALELDSNGEFVMRDDYNGGVRRAVDTLSGGETFLTSLCLAIALSSHIQLKGSAPLEFFFLDEGFGTLDSDLLETVITSLEKLQNDRLSVGIISHVEELKNRVPVKLIVTPAKPGIGTEVHIEYS